MSPTSFGPYTALRFTGFFYAPYTAQYDFHAHGADGAIVWMDDQRTPFLEGNRASPETVPRFQLTMVPSAESHWRHGCRRQRREQPSPTLVGCS